MLQDALVSLDPLQPIRNEIAEPLDAHARLSKAEIRERTIQLLTEVGVPQPEIRKDQYPGELSGGLRQRALIATALALHPPVIIADEPTTALDVVVQAQVLGVLAQLIARGTSLILISHDLAVVARLADRILVMKSGIIVESGTRDEVLGNPQHAYTKALIQAVPSGDTRGRRLSPAAPARIGRPRRHGEAAENDSATPILEAKHLSKSFHGPDGRLREAVADVSFELFKGEVLGIVGASGSGKSTLARLLLALTDYDAGAVLYRGLEWPRADDRTKRRVRGKISVVYQDPYSSFDPRWNVGRILEDALRLHAEDGHAPQRADLLELLEAVGLNESHLRARPRHLSGGQRQRVAIARALAVHPEILILDEAVSALDVSIQAQILDLLEDLKARYSLSILFISHDLGVIHHIADRVLVMKDGAVVEEGDADAVFHAPPASLHAGTGGRPAAFRQLARRGTASLKRAPPWAPPVVAPGRRQGPSFRGRRPLPGKERGAARPQRRCPRDDGLAEHPRFRRNRASDEIPGNGDAPATFRACAARHAPADGLFLRSPGPSPVPGRKRSTSLPRNAVNVQACGRGCRPSARAT
ncbi:ATP-binding cassette domain-containing protein [Azotobacter vinelandii]